MKLGRQKQRQMFGTTWHNAVLPLIHEAKDYIQGVPVFNACEEGMCAICMDNKVNIGYYHPKQGVVHACCCSECDAQMYFGPIIELLCHPKYRNQTWGPQLLLEMVRRVWKKTFHVNMRGEVTRGKHIKCPVCGDPDFQRYEIDVDDDDDDGQEPTQQQLQQLPPLGGSHPGAYPTRGGVSFSPPAHRTSDLEAHRALPFTGTHTAHDSSMSLSLQLPSSPHISNLHSRAV
eukprot:CAMPEP_0197844998 /NCGR_PEP_ID=MMETSP1438-20131217/1954_1 /TAXON_ID=1461541 /ORGANISM="Pterosperma sp., Strain CCMP1384" /LENGTH=230 /DNA_ID=CAMNT_0043456059 /DNA_START=461 /DNA_END=1153 /DNA_ORIENTATION=-